MLFRILTVSALSAASTLSFAQAALPPVLVTAVVQSGNMMPSPGVRRRLETRVTFTATVACAGRDSFELRVKTRPAIAAGRDRQVLSIVQTEADLCEIVARDAEFTLSTDELNLGAHVTVENPLLMERHVSF